MIWFILSLACAVSEAVKDTASKLAMKDSDPLTLSLGSCVLPLIYFIPSAFTQPLPPIDGHFYLALVCHSSLFSISLYLYVNALKTAELSLTIPLICFTPAFFLITSPLILGETVSFTGFLGILLIVSGAYALHRSPRNSGLLAPLKSIFNAESARSMLLVAFIWSLTGNFDRMGLTHSSFAVWAAADLSAVALCLAVARGLSASSNPLFTRANLLAACFNSLSIYFYYWAASIQKVAYVITVKRCSVLIGVFLGFLLFGEKNLRQRSLGAVLMLLGVVAIAFAR